MADYCVMPADWFAAGNKCGDDWECDYCDYCDNWKKRGGKMAKSYTVEELRRLEREYMESGHAWEISFLWWLDSRDKAAELHPIAKIIGSECANADPGQTIAKSISDACKKHDLRLWPEVTQDMIDQTLNYYDDQEGPTDMADILRWLRDTFSVGGK